MHDYWCMLFKLMHMLMLAFYCLHVDVNLKVLVCLLFLCVDLCVRVGTCMFMCARQ